MEESRKIGPSKKSSRHFPRPCSRQKCLSPKLYRLSLFPRHLWHLGSSRFGSLLIPKFISRLFGWLLRIFASLIISSGLLQNRNFFWAHFLPQILKLSIDLGQKFILNFRSENCWIGFCWFACLLIQGSVFGSGWICRSWILFSSINWIAF